MNSPQPLSALQRGARSLFTPFFCLQEKGDRGMSTWRIEEYFKFLLVIRDSHLFYMSFLLKFSISRRFIRIRLKAYPISSTGTVRRRIPKISGLLYHTTSPSINVPVRMAFTMKKGMRMTRKERKKVFKTLILETNAAKRIKIISTEYIKV